MANRRLHGNVASDFTESLLSELKRHLWILKWEGVRNDLGNYQGYACSQATRKGACHFQRGSRCVKRRKDNRELKPGVAFAAPAPSGHSGCWNKPFEDE